ncbi:MAG TPA: LuxR C-terminal-related transcriptional regulator [Actinophytocola sp.]|nr:LuxR C-terminal-related transcriptional regulator [Actinophytocola sp.]
MTVSGLLTTANREVLLMARPGCGRLGTFRRIDHENVRRGVRYRIVVPDSARTGRAAARLGELVLAGADVRTVPEIPGDALVIDGAVVVLPADTSTDTAVFHLTSLVATTAELFERIWFTAVPMTPAAPATTDLGTRERVLLSLLSAGSTDESAAARLGVSVRTVRRMVAGLMHQLGARSRFQAGAKAADRGWLVEHAC